jgi:hypothetical protein
VTIEDFMVLALRFTYTGMLMMLLGAVGFFGSIVFLFFRGLK